MYEFTREVIRLYGCTLHKFSENVYGEEKVSHELLISTHYEKMDIAKSNRIHYVMFSLPESLSEEDETLKKLVHDKEKG